MIARRLSFNKFRMNGGRAGGGRRKKFSAAQISYLLARLSGSHERSTDIGLQYQQICGK